MFANVSWHRADVCKCLLYDYKNWSRSACQDEPAWQEPCTRTTPTPPRTPSCTSALFQRLDCTNNTRHQKLHLNAKIDADRPMTHIDRVMAWWVLTRHCSIKLCRAISQSILVRWRRFLHVNAANDLYYLWCNGGMTGNIRKQTRSNIVGQWKICLVYTCSTRTVYDRHNIFK